MTSLALIGECMMELNAIDTLNFKRSFGGDTYNTAVYAKRWQPNIPVYYLSAIGTDTLSNEMLTQWKAEDLNTDYVLTSDTAQLGIYAITNESGVRDVSYWRKDSAAIQIMKLLEEKGGIEFLPKFDYLYFTGISLGILSDVDKEKLLDLVKQMKKQGTVIAFDPNYRKKLWSSIEEAARWITKAYEICDIAFPGVGDHKAIFGHLDHKEVYAYISQFNCNEIIIKSGANGVYGYVGKNDAYHVPYKAATRAIDSTAAGDSFSGTYLASKISGDDMQTSLQIAADVAMTVVQHPGAIRFY